MNINLLISFNIRLHSSLFITLESSALWACFVILFPLVVFICAMCFNAVFFFFTLSEFQETTGSLFRVPGARSCITIDWESLILPLSLFHPFYHISFNMSVLLDWLRLVSNKNRARLLFCIMQVWVQRWITLGLEEDWVQWVHTKRGEPCNCLSEWLREHSLGWW